MNEILTLDVLKTGVKVIITEWRAIANDISLGLAVASLAMLLVSVGYFSNSRIGK